MTDKQKIEMKEDSIENKAVPADEWISVDERLPETKFDFETMLETQYISNQILIKPKEEHCRIPIPEIKAYFVIKNGVQQWSLSDTGTSQYYKLSLASHWKYL